MKPIPKKRIFKKILIPIIYGCEQISAINSARAIASEEDVMLLGLVFIPEADSLSSATVHVQKVRQTLKNLSIARHGHRWTEVYATHRPWEEIVRVAETEKPDVLILEYPCQFETLQTTPEEVLAHPPCDIAIVNSHISNNWSSVLIPIR